MDKGVNKVSRLDDKSTPHDVRNLNLALFAIENVSDNDLEYLLEAIQQERILRRVESSESERTRSNKNNSK